MSTILLLALLVPACGGLFHDGDGDGFTRDADCDDRDSAIHPGAEEILNGRDDDCDDAVDNGTVLTDDDGDGFTEIEGDCDDSAVTTYPGAPELPDGLDQSCDRDVDEQTELSDDDRDGFSEEAGDCDDANVRTWPGAPEVCADGMDNDCNSVNDDLDADGDGFISGDCGGDDCADDDADAYPGAQERVGDLIDNDCNGSRDENWATDTIVSPDAGVSPGADDLNGPDPEGSFIDGCNSADAYEGYSGYAMGTKLPITVVRVANSSGAGGVSDASLEAGIERLDTYFSDLGVEFTVQETVVLADDTYRTLTPGEGSDLVNRYADAAQSTILVVITDALDFGGGSGTTTGWALDPRSSRQYMALDQDFLDGFTWAHEMGHYFGLPHTFEGTDDGTDPELADGSNCRDAGDSVCDTPSDPGPDWWNPSGCSYDRSTCAATCGADSEGDIHHPDTLNLMSYYHCGDEHFTTIQTQQMLCIIDRSLDTLPIGQDTDGDGYVSEVDCDDANGDVHPDALERCNAEDDDCDGMIDNNAADERTWYPDADGDGFGLTSSATDACTEPPGYALGDDDCDDDDDTVYPGAPTSCVDYDQDCDGAPESEDTDGDGYIGCDECDDTNADVSPTAAEPFDGVDNDCSGYIDDDPNEWPSACSLNYYGDSAYAFCTSPAYDWWEASDACAGYGYHLVILNDGLEWVFVNEWAASVTPDGSSWIGASEEAADSVYLWVDGSALTYPIDSPAAAVTPITAWPWAPGEPSNHDGGEGCIELDEGSHFEWNDEACSDQQNWICEAGDGR